MVRLLPLCVLLLTATTGLSFGQVNLDAAGSVVLGSTVTNSDFRVHILSSASSGNHTGLKVGQTLSGIARNGIQVASSGGGSFNRAVWARGFGPATAYGVYGEALDATNRFAIYGKADVQTGSYAGYFNGDVFVSGTITNPSDAKLKERSAPLVQAGILLRLMQLVPKSYYFKTSAEYAHMNLPSTMQYGLIAQEVELVFPELVRDEVQPPRMNDEGRHVGEPLDFKSVSYTKLIPLLLAAIQEQQRRIEALEVALQD